MRDGRYFQTMLQQVAYPCERERGWGEGVGQENDAIWTTKKTNLDKWGNESNMKT